MEALGLTDVTSPLQGGSPGTGELTWAQQALQVKQMVY